MGKKKKQSQNSNHGDSSESESSKDGSTQGAEANKTLCAHISKSVKTSAVRRNIKTNKDKNIHSICSLCKKNESSSSKGGWVCMRCGCYCCGTDEENHRVDHYKTPRSDSHFLAFQINTNIIWCFNCEREIPIDVNKKQLQGCVDLIIKQYTDHLPFNNITVETDHNKMNGIDSMYYSKQETSTCQPLESVCQNKTVMKPVTNIHKVRGLVNLGNTCFFNSVLQCLAQTPGLVELLHEMDVPGERFHLELDGRTIDTVLEKHKTSTLSEHLARILTEVSGGNDDLAAGDLYTKPWMHTANPKRLLDALTNKCPQFEGGAQHDAHELLRHLLDTVHTEDLRRYQKAILDHIGFNKSLDDVDEDNKIFGKKLNQKVCETMPIRPDQIFKGSLVSILKCTECSHISKREETFLDLSLPVAHEKAVPPGARRKQNCSSPVEEKQITDVTMSKHQKRRVNKTRHNHKIRNGNEREDTQGEPTIEEEDKKDSIDEEQSDADVEDNEDNACEEQDHKTEIVESGYSSEKQMSTRGSPVTTQSLDEESKLEVPQFPVFQGCEPNPTEYIKPTSGVVMYSATNNLLEDPEAVVAKRAESGLGSIQELTVTIPEEVITECTSQDSVRVNASNGSPDISLNSQHGNVKSVDLSLSDYKLPPSSDSQIDRRAMVYDWNCTGDAKTQSQDSSSASLSVSPQCGSQSSQDVNNASPKDSPMSESHSNDNMSVCKSLPENVSMILNSPIKSQNSLREENSGSEERPESRMECRKNRSSPVELGEPTELDSGLLKLSLEGMTCAGDIEDSDGIEEHTVTSFANPDESQNELMLVGGVMANKNSILQPPPQPLLTSSYSFTYPEHQAPRYNINPRYKIEEGECSLQSCLNQFTMIEMLAGGNKVGCEACTEKFNKGNKDGKTVYRNSNKQLLICNLPPVMIFHLKRFQVQRCSFRKIGKHVKFPLVLDISPFCSLKEGNKSGESMLYSLYGVVEHSGTLHGGHYVAYVKVRLQSERRAGVSPPGKWFYVSDSRVSDIDESSVLKTQAYLLFYERIP